MIAFTFDIALIFTDGHFRYFLYLRLFNTAFKHATKKKFIQYLYEPKNLLSSASKPMSRTNYSLFAPTLKKAAILRYTSGGFFQQRNFCLFCQPYHFAKIKSVVLKAIKRKKTKK